VKIVRFSHLSPTDADCVLLVSFFAYFSIVNLRTKQFFRQTLQWLADVKDTKYFESLIETCKMFSHILLENEITIMFIITDKTGVIAYILRSNLFNLGVGLQALNGLNV
jgi:hypothetical protein